MCIKLASPLSHVALVRGGVHMQLSTTASFLISIVQQCNCSNIELLSGKVLIGFILQYLNRELFEGNLGYFEFFFSESRETL